MTQYTKGRSVVLFQEAYEYLTRDLGLEVSYVLDLDEERQVSGGRGIGCHVCHCRRPYPGRFCG